MKPNVDLRRRVLDASLALIDSAGLEAFSMREVARRAGVSHQAPYHYFADREAIMAAIVAEGFLRNCARSCSRQVLGSATRTSA
ncbi:MAG: TetR/AcrR family transcriptional regulator [Terricaulis sp.]|nr:TetR/AcrR family transcriptional regulator [Terricaulis sp.]